MRLLCLAGIRNRFLQCLFVPWEFLGRLNAGRFLRCWALVLLVVAWGSSVQAQTLTRTADWEQPGATVPEAQSYAYTLKIDSNAPILLTQTCAAVASTTRCTAPLAASLLTPGTHTLILTASNSFGSASSAALTGAPPTGPVTFKLTFTISIP